jgi:hypothetical protein
MSDIERTARRGGQNNDLPCFFVLGLTGSIGALPKVMGAGAVNAAVYAFVAIQHVVQRFCLPTHGPESMQAWASQQWQIFSRS